MSMEPNNPGQDQPRFSLTDTRQKSRTICVDSFAPSPVLSLADPEGLNRIIPDAIRATVEFPTPVCPIASNSREAGTTIDSVKSTIERDGAGHVIEFTMEPDHDSDADVTPVFSDEPFDRFRLVNDDIVGCPCDTLQMVGCPVKRAVAQYGTLTILFEAADFDQLKRAIAVLRDRFPDTDIKRLVWAPTRDREVTEPDTSADCLRVLPVVDRLEMMEDFNPLVTPW